MPRPDSWAHLDLRSLALFRMGLGAILLFDTLSRMRSIEDFYTDSGVLPRLTFAQSEFSDVWLCFHLGFEGWWGQFFLLAVQGALALGLCLGWHTRLMTAGSWILLNSLLVRNPFVNDRGDLQLALLLFWSFFLPLGARWSLDARQKRDAWGAAKGIAGGAFVFQIALIYLCTALLKYGDFWLVRGDGLYHSLKSPLFSTTLSLWLSQLPALVLKLMNYGVIAAELFVGILLLVPRSVTLLRSTALALLFAFHACVFFTFQLGIFPLVGLITLLALLPTAFWEGLRGGALEAWLNRKLGEQTAKELGLSSGIKVFLAACLLMVVVSNASNRPGARAFEPPAFLDSATEALRLSQHWDLFSPIPPYNGHFELASVEGEKSSIPTVVEFANHRWRMLMIASLYPRFSSVRPGVAKTLARRLSLEGQIHYAFSVQLVNPNGDLEPPVVWRLWQGQL